MEKFEKYGYYWAKSSTGFEDIVELDKNGVSWKAEYHKNLFTPLAYLGTNFEQFKDLFIPSETFFNVVKSISENATGQVLLTSIEDIKRAIEKAEKLNIQIKS